MVESLFAPVSTVLLVAIDFFDCILVKSSKFTAFVGCSHLMFWLLWRFWTSNFSRRVLSSEIPEAELSVARSCNRCRFKSVLAAVLAAGVVAVGDDAVADARQLLVVAVDVVGHALDLLVGAERRMPDALFALESVQMRRS